MQRNLNNDKGLDVFLVLKIFKTKHDKTSRNASNEQGYAAKRQDKTFLSVTKQNRALP